ncbi:MAG: hypothetical protein JWN42_1585 [Candidatus Angelobacter sp.]|nr:hypothetical protein [Candidatus Angelobacter sp.]
MLSRYAGVCRSPQHARFSLLGWEFTGEIPSEAEGAPKDLCTLSRRHSASRSSHHALVPTPVPAGDDW